MGSQGTGSDGEVRTKSSEGATSPSCPISTLLGGDCSPQIQGLGIRGGPSHSWAYASRIWGRDSGTPPEQESRPDSASYLGDPG